MIISQLSNYSTARAVGRFDNPVGMRTFEGEGASHISSKIWGGLGGDAPPPRFRQAFFKLAQVNQFGYWDY